MNTLLYVKERGHESEQDILQRITYRQYGYKSQQLKRQGQ